MDAVHSYGNREKKLEILKDSHIGAFAVIMLATYVLAAAGAFSYIFENKNMKQKRYRRKRMKCAERI